MLAARIAIDEGKCDGCGLCVTACHEGAIALVNGKAKIVREEVCDGLGDCVTACPRGAISFTDAPPDAPSGPPVPIVSMNGGPIAGSDCQWPIQIALVPTRSDLFRGTLVVASDCSAFVVDDFRSRVLRGDPVVIGCPKLDDRARFDKIGAILRDNDITDVRVIRMEVPCCSKLMSIVMDAASNCGRDVSVEEVVISRGGKVLRSPFRGDCPNLSMDTEGQPIGLYIHTLSIS